MTELPDLRSLTSKDELSRLAPEVTLTTFVLPQDEAALVAADEAGGGPWWQRPIATTGGAGDHRLASVDDAEWVGTWVVQPDVDGERQIVRARVTADPVTLLVDATAPPACDRVLAAAVGAVRHAV